MRDKDINIRLFIIDGSADAFLSDIRPIRSKDKLVLSVSLEGILKFIKSEKCDKYNMGFFHVGWLDILNRGSDWYENEKILEKLKESKQDPSQPWFLFSGGIREIVPPFDPPLFYKDELQSFYAKIKEGKISTVSEFYRKIGYRQS